MSGRVEWGLLAGRLILGIIMLAHGIQKLAGIENTIAIFEKIGQPAWLAYVTAIVEAIGGASLILGIFVVPSAIILGMTMVGAIVLAKLPMGLIGGFEFPLSLLGLSIILAVTGSRKYSLSSVVTSQRS
ncbi:DoxX family protein [Guptibacillus algicola]|uniref:DoxX family protein n=1 Tax=Guptibacillus algicola TaxID=225844 RepID=UPI001CD5B161|nr:DoxX family protein [Alkalihalobacillus algicola]MCA0989519.1 DoxX family protein [Alkalihalobacillus algicola]